SSDSAADPLGPARREDPDGRAECGRRNGGQEPARQECGRDEPERGADPDQNADRIPGAHSEVSLAAGLTVAVRRANPRTDPAHGRRPAPARVLFFGPLWTVAAHGEP